jgi:hypothetical protein
MKWDKWLVDPCLIHILPPAAVLLPGFPLALLILVAHVILALTAVKLIGKPFFLFQEGTVAS